VRARLLRRKAEHLALSGPFRRQVGEASDAHATREPAIDGGCSELATDNRLVGSSSPLSPTTQSCANGDFPVHARARRAPFQAAARHRLVQRAWSQGALKNFALKQRTNLNKMAAINFFSFPAITNLNCSYDRRSKKDHSCYQSHDSYSPFY
jgi:hypothetical protein